MWDESDTRTPMICLLSMGSDPTAMIEDLAKKNGIGLHCSILYIVNAPHAIVCDKTYSYSLPRTVGTGADLWFTLRVSF